jgi:2-polyprenyl-6-methoxyphenol hydroxylase-like FAD-dependent oxidoreductase
LAVAYVLAAALAATNDHTAAFADYERRMMPFLSKKQRSAARLASSFVPKSALGLHFRDLVTRFMRVPAVADWFIARDLRDAIVLPRMP